MPSTEHLGAGLYRLHPDRPRRSPENLQAIASLREFLSRRSACNASSGRGWSPHGRRPARRRRLCVLISQAVSGSGVLAATPTSSATPDHPQPGMSFTVIGVLPSSLGFPFVAVRSSTLRVFEQEGLPAGHHPSRHRLPHFAPRAPQARPCTRAQAGGWPAGRSMRGCRRGPIQTSRLEAPACWSPLCVSRRISSARSARCSSRCLPPSVACCTSRARTSRTSCLRASPRAGRRSPSAPRSAQPAHHIVFAVPDRERPDRRARRRCSTSCWPHGVSTCSRAWRLISFPRVSGGRARRPRARLRRRPCPS